MPIAIKATLMIEYADATERARRLGELRGFERRCWMRVAGFDAVYAIADEDLARENDTKTSAVHFLRFEFAAAMIAAARAGAALAAGTDHPEYRHSVDPLPAGLRGELLADFA
jgi:ABC-type Fe2+-enterobactin transport system substrate-binding protein